MLLMAERAACNRRRFTPQKWGMFWRTTAIDAACFLLHKKSFLYIRCGNHAGFFFSKPFIPVTGEPFVNRIPQEARNDDECEEKPRRQLQMPGNANGCGRMKTYLVVFDKYNAVRHFGNMVRCQHVAGRLRLKRREPQGLLTVVPDGEVDHPVAVVAHAIE